ncbi:TetR/AcrR family transcriptional regulator (plasmid) [Thioclava sp. 'Guangxiensis']|uniref:TetR/AcrR family transcriptional regulator n=1 Tax=Thioclava sp. 'Guangxiensis' TaxID=3149044 RepID=UPI0032C45BF9
MGKKEDILKTAQRLFSENGYHAVGVDRITAESGASKMTLYSHFGTKENLIAEVLKCRDDEFISSLMMALEARAGGMDRLKALFDWHRDWFNSPSFHGCMFIRASEEFAERETDAIAISRAHKVLVRNLLRDCLARAGMVHTEPVTDLLFVILEGMIVNTHMFGVDTRAEVSWPIIEILVSAHLPKH